MHLALSHPCIDTSDDEVVLGQPRSSARQPPLRPHPSFFNEFSRLALVTFFIRRPLGSSNSTFNALYVTKEVELPCLLDCASEELPEDPPVLRSFEVWPQLLKLPGRI